MTVVNWVLSAVIVVSVSVAGYLLRKEARPGAQTGSSGALAISTERARQRSEEGWTEDHDDEHCNGELVKAAVTYALAAISRVDDGLWPWSPEWFKPAGQYRMLVKAGALIAAELDRLERVESMDRTAP